MGAVKWNGAERTETDDGIIIKTHREFTGTSWDDLLEIPVDTCLQGSAFYNITAGKAAFWDGSENWVETDGTEHKGVAELYWFFGYMRPPEQISEGDTLNVLPRQVEAPATLVCFDKEPNWETGEGSLEIHGAVSDASYVTAEDNYQWNVYSIDMEGKKAGAVTLDVTIPSLGRTVTFPVTIADE